MLQHWPKVPRIALAAMIAALPGGALISLLERWIRGNDAFYDDCFWFWFCVAAIGFLVAAVHLQAIPLTAKDEAEPAHWVTIGKATAIVCEKGRTLIELIDGRRLPVSRPFVERAMALVQKTAAAYRCKGRRDFICVATNRLLGARARDVGIQH